ncbi:MAG: urease accessory protein UreD [Sulfitobacter sp.]
MSLDTSSPISGAQDQRGTFVPRAQGEVDLSMFHRDGATHLSGLRQSGCMKCILPQVFRPDAEAVLVNTAGGVTGGDAIRVRARVGANSQLSMTTQAAERIYRTSDGTNGRIDTRIEVEAGARLNWLPQETILFDQSRLRRDLQFNLAADARLLLCETLVFGRAAMGEDLRQLYLDDRIRVMRDGRPVYLDGIRFEGDIGAQLARGAITNGAGALATLVFAAPDAEALLPHVRALLPDTAGASLRSPELLVLRAVAGDSLDLRRYMIPVLEKLSGQSLPAVWRL